MPTSKNQLNFSYRHLKQAQVPFRIVQHQLLTQIADAITLNSVKTDASHPDYVTHKVELLVFTPEEFYEAVQAELRILEQFKTP